jgi:hypothetical protein
MPTGRAKKERPKDTPKPSEPIELWCGQTANLLYDGTVLEVLSADRIKIANHWLDGSVHECVVDIEPGNLSRTEDGWIGIVKE